MGKPKGSPKTGGRKKGTINKTTAELRDIIMAAFDKAGGAKYLVKQAEDNPNAFMALLGKILPKDVIVSGDEDGGPMIVKIERVIIDKPADTNS